MELPVIDLFAGPGGLGEGFCSFNGDGLRYRIIASAEKDSYAHKTLTLRAYYRYLQEEYREYLSDYYDYCVGRSSSPYTEKSMHVWKKAQAEALLVELGTEKGNADLKRAINDRLTDFNENAPLVLIGGPPCQAYSLAGRAKNMNNREYDATKDHRNFLYKEYLKVLEAHKPAVFVMENVKGILSSKVGNTLIFNQILQDLADPSKALFDVNDGTRYVLCSLVADVQFHAGDDPTKIDSRSFIVKSEEYGIPQSRHRVILLGIREDYFPNHVPTINKKNSVSVEEVIGDLPKLRSKFSKLEDSAENWAQLVSERLIQISEMLAKRKSKSGKELAKKITEISKNISADKLSVGSLQLKPDITAERKLPNIPLRNWYLDVNLEAVLNHETRGHILSDIVRYGYAACFAEVEGRSPRGHEEYDLVHLSPSHKNWNSGKFVDRFRVQEKNKPASTITSHISKDGHYFIHYDPSQARSLTVREAARIQTFPDNYFFQGPRTQQYHQVGNAVPPLLARKIAEVVAKIISTRHYR